MTSKYCMRCLEKVDVHNMSWCGKNSILHKYQMDYKNIPADLENVICWSHIEGGSYKNPMCVGPLHDGAHVKCFAVWELEVYER